MIGLRNKFIKNIQILSQKLSTLGSQTRPKMKLLDQSEAINIDDELFTNYKFSVDQLMELAGLSCAHAIYECYPVERNKCVLILCGPGNNGGDGLVCARHLSLMNYCPVIYCPKVKKTPLFENLIHQCKGMGISFLNESPDINNIQNFNLIVDALFGFSFQPPVKQPFNDILTLIKNANISIASIDIPSGWDVEKGPPDNTAISPNLLISLTAPKLCSQYFKGEFHILGGRFIPLELQKKYDLELPVYTGTNLFVKLN